ncbi:unnamed protein product [Spirodela intermedia]|uniref:Hydrophobic seed protein domain-containing protein n=1 Tax=Spirodela intermedia TaxID=51605 RepID=A0A7I8J5L0_SPIIN|nr:unnamed protein product [Spirodela intermedia]CAA6665381.1 unnamed protein product [Spirodela intermedia]CAA6674169.1 unnamed protein product [Spirodela intermedia]
MASKIGACTAVLLLSLLFFTSAARLSVCSSVVRGLKLGFLPPRFPCCRVVRQLSDQQATTCLCYAARFGFLGLRVRIPGDLVQLLFYCGRPVPSGFTCS